MGIKFAAQPTQPLVSPTKQPPALSKRVARKTPVKPAAKGTVKRARKSPLTALGLTDPRLALLCVPSEFVDCTLAHDTLDAAPIETPETLMRLTPNGRIRGFGADRTLIWSVPSPAYPHGGAVGWNLLRDTQRSDIELEDEAGDVAYLSVFGGHRAWLDVAQDHPLLILGELKRFGNRYYVTCRRLLPDRALGRVWARYVGSSSLSGEKIEAVVAAAWADETAPRACASHIVGETGLAERVLLQACQPEVGEGFASLDELLTQLHKPDSMRQANLALESAKRITAFAIQAAAVRHHSRPTHPKAPLPVRASDLVALIAQLNMPLTREQHEVATAITLGMSEPAPMTALLSGDVGTGKTLAFLLPAVAAHLAGARVTILAPRVLLADQIAQEIDKHFGTMVSKLERIEAGGRIKDPSSLLVGTSGLTGVARRQAYVPQLLITDEQHKFSATDREALVGEYTHVVEVSATPVPRSLAATLYEGMQVLNLRQCPVAKTINSEVLDMTRRADVIASIREALSRGERAAVVYPQVNATDPDKANSVEAAFASLDQAFPGQAIMLHGEMDDGQLRANIGMLRAGSRRLVVASTVLEIGIDIPSISLMVVRDADRFGISQLHQLRGRLARNGGRGRFMMVVESISTTPLEALQRLEAVAATNDGYELAEIDLLKRGFGDLDGQAQSGSSRTLFKLLKLGPADFLHRKVRTESAQMMARVNRRTDDHAQQRLI